MTEEEKARTSKLSQHARVIVWSIVIGVSLGLIVGVLLVVAH